MVARRIRDDGESASNDCAHPKARKTVPRINMSLLKILSVSE